MNLLYIVLPSAVVLTIAYLTYGRLLTRLFALDPSRKTPAHELKDGVDYEPLSSTSLVPQHFSAIAAAGPIVGPILAGLTFGWLPALIWILVGSILIGGVHDFGALVASIRHKARSIAEVVRDNMSKRSYLLFLSFIWIALVYIIVAFTDVTATSFLGPPTPENGNVGGGAIASASLMYLGLTILMGLCVRYLKLRMSVATVVFMLLVGAAILAGPKMPLDVAQLMYRPAEASAGGDYAVYASAKQGDAAAIATIAQARKGWDVALLIYCLLAGIAPVWMILQPRGQLGGYFLYLALGAGVIGLILGGGEAQYPAFRGWEASLPGTTAMQALWPMLFITIACGACSGFHSLIASGTTSKQLKTESDAKVVGYGTMLMEAMVAIVSLSCVMMFAAGAPELSGSPAQIYAQGISRFLEAVNLPKGIGMSFALMAFATFVYDTLDVCTRLGRFIIQELTGWHNWFGRLLGTGLTAGVPIYFLLVAPNVVITNGIAAPPKPVWLTFWNLFGASNQLLAALTLLGITVWLWRTRQAWWVWIVTGLPTVWMYVMSTWALGTMTLDGFRGPDGQWIVPTEPVPWVGVVLIGLAALMLIEAIRILSSLGTPPAASQPEPALATSLGGAAS
jgi:carbon starvation protein